MIHKGDPYTLYMIQYDHREREVKDQKKCPFLTLFFKFGKLILK